MHEESLLKDKVVEVKTALQCKEAELLDSLENMRQYERSRSDEVDKMHHLLNAQLRLALEKQASMEKEQVLYTSYMHYTLYTLYILYTLYTIHTIHYTL